MDQRHSCMQLPVEMQTWLNSFLTKGLELMHGHGKLTSLAHAAWNGKVDVVRLLLRRGADMEKMDRKGKTPLIHAVWEGKTDAVKLLLNQGANINARRCDRQTVLDIADQYGTRDMYNLLFDRGARGGRGYLDRW